MTKIRGIGENPPPPIVDDPPPPANPNSCDSNPNSCDSSGLDWTLLGLDLTLTLARTGLRGTGTFPLPRIPTMALRQLSFNPKGHGDLDQKIERPLRYMELALASTSFGLDLLLENQIFPDSALTGATLVHPMSWGTGIFFSDEFDKAIRPVADYFFAKGMLDYTRPDLDVNLGQMAYLMAQGIFADDRVRAFANKQDTTYTPQDPDALVDYVIGDTGYPEGIDTEAEKDAYEAEIAELIRRAGRKGQAFYDYMAILKAKYEIDLTEDRLGQLVNAAAQDSEQISPPDPLTASIQALGLVGTAQNTNLSFVSAFGVHAMIANMINRKGERGWGELAHLAGLAVPIANIAINTANGLSFDEQGRTIATDLAATTLGLVASEAAGDDKELRLDIASTMTNIGPAFYYPQAIAGLAALDESHHATDSNGNAAGLGFSTAKTLQHAISGMQGLGNLYSGYVAGQHLLRGIETGNLGEYLPLAIVGISQLIETGMYIHLMQARDLPNNSYDFADNHLVPENPVEGNKGLEMPMAISAGSTALGVGLGLLREALRDEPHDADAKPGFTDRLTLGGGPAGTMGLSVGLTF